MADYLKDVPGSSPEPEDDHNAPAPADLPQDEHQGADPGAGGGEGEGDGEGGRTIENVYRELSRKQEQLQERLFEQLAESQRMLVETIRGSERPSERKTGNTLDDMSVSELETFRAQVAEQNPDKLSEYDSYLNNRRVDAKVSEAVQQVEQRSRVESAKVEANRTAVSRYPELGRRGSEFYVAVNQRLSELGDSYVSANPRAVLDAANDVAAERGMTANVGTSSRMRGRVAGGRPGGNAPVNEGTEDAHKHLPKSAASTEDRAKIAARLRGAMPKGKDFDDAKITDRMDDYGKHLNYFLRG